jgi:hypothetical protein
MRAAPHPLPCAPPRGVGTSLRPPLPSSPRPHLPAIARATLALALALATLCAALPASALAVDFEVASRTVAQAFEYLRVGRGPDEDSVVARQRITQYINLNSHDILSDGKHQLRFHSMMRFDTDLALSGQDLDAVSFGLSRRYNQFHIMYAYLEAQRLWGRLDLRLGRQLMSDVLGWYDYDGLWLSGRLWRGLSVDLYGGMEVKQDVLPINDAAFDADGTNPQGSRDGLFDRPVYALGAGLQYTDSDYGQARITYRRSFWHPTHGVERERLGAHASVRPLKPLRIYGGAVYNLFIARIDQADAGVEWRFADPDLTVGAEYARLVPYFDADSIFNVFSTYAFDEARARVGWQLNDDLYTSLRAGVRLYGHDADLNVENASGDTAFNLNWALRWRTWGGVSTSLNHQTEVSYAGRRHTTSVGAQSPFFFDLWRVTGRVMHANFDSTYTRALTGNAFGVNLGTSIKLGQFGQFELLGEQATNPFVKNELRILALIDLHFNVGPTGQ